MKYKIISISWCIWSGRQICLVFFVCRPCPVSVAQHCFELAVASGKFAVAPGKLFVVAPGKLFAVVPGKLLAVVSGRAELYVAG